MVYPLFKTGDRLQLLLWNRLFLPSRQVFRLVILLDFDVFGL